MEFWEHRSDWHSRILLHQVDVPLLGHPWADLEQSTLLPRVKRHYFRAGLGIILPYLGHPCLGGIWTVNHSILASIFRFGDFPLGRPSLRGFYMAKWGCWALFQFQVFRFIIIYETSILAVISIQIWCISSSAIQWFWCLLQYYGFVIYILVSGVTCTLWYYSS